MKYERPWFKASGSVVDLSFIKTPQERAHCKESNVNLFTFYQGVTRRSKVVEEYGCEVHQPRPDLLLWHCDDYYDTIYV